MTPFHPARTFCTSRYISGCDTEPDSVTRVNKNKQTFVKEAFKGKNLRVCITILAVLATGDCCRYVQTKRPEAGRGLHISSMFNYLENHPVVLYVIKVNIAATHGMYYLN